MLALIVSAADQRALFWYPRQMMKYLLLLVLFAVLWWVWKKRAGLPPPGAGPDSPLPERMVRCAHCGVHLPESDGVVDGKDYFCNDAHRQAARKSTQ